MPSRFFRTGVDDRIPQQKYNGREMKAQLLRHCCSGSDKGSVKIFYANNTYYLHRQNNG